MTRVARKVISARAGALAILLSVLFTAGCNNECQQLCGEIADYVAHCEDTASNFTLPFSHDGSSVSDCRRHFSRTNRIEGSDLTPFARYRNTCRHLIGTTEDSSGDSIVTLRAQFTCDEMQNGPGQAFGAGVGGTR